MAEEIKKISLANLAYYDEKLKAWIVKSVQNGAAVTIKSDTTTPGAAKTYTIMQADQLIGTIDIPKDMVVQSGTVEVDPAGQPKGTYMVLTLANATQDKLYINVGSLVDIYTAKQSATQVQLAINSSTREISATLVNDAVDTQHIKDKAITIDKLSDAVKELIEETAKKVGGGAVYLEPTGSNGVWTATTDKIEAYENGQQIMIKCPEARTGSITININDLGAKNIYKNTGKGIISATTITPMLFVYNETIGGFIQLIDQNTTYSNATKTTNGLMSQQDKTFLDKIKENRLAGFGITTGTAPNYTVTIPDLTSIIEGTLIAVKFHAKSGTNNNVKLSVNGNTAVPLVNNDDINGMLSHNAIKENSIHILLYQNSKWYITTLLKSATTKSDGLLGYQDKQKLDKLNSRICGYYKATGGGAEWEVTASGVNATQGTMIVIQAPNSMANNQNVKIKLNSGSAISLSLDYNGNEPVITGKHVSPTKDCLVVYSGLGWTLLNPDVVLNTATLTTDGLMSKEDKANLDNLTARKTPYAVATGTSTSLKATIDGVTLVTGTKITLKCGSGISATANLNVNDLGAKAILGNGTNNKALPRGTYDFIYDGTYWAIEGHIPDASTTARGLMSADDKQTVDSIVPLLQDIETLLAEV